MLLARRIEISRVAHTADRYVQEAERKGALDCLLPLPYNNSAAGVGDEEEKVETKHMRNDRFTIELTKLPVPFVYGEHVNFHCHIINKILITPE